ncbi:GntR family transcriptional regulator [Beijerinckia sp. L45]|uniref:GntR family transcriptional regulator n=1 Tax=Beijerinckia sp. L45 TaxID=1641855 RepID=UPI00131D6E71|nr:GntR family transcriptional regulator [Beijerinckia sp. L45]
MSIAAKDTRGFKLSAIAAVAPSMADRAYNYVVERLSDGTLRGGDAIQESRLAESLNLSRTPIRDALGRLEGEGLLVRAGRALTVRTVTIREFLDMLQVRRLLEPEAAWLACGKIKSSVLETFRDRVTQAPELPHSINAWALDEDIHLAVVDALHNDYLADLVRNLRRRTRLFELTEFPGKSQSAKTEHLRLIDALLGNDPEGAKRAMFEHLDGLRTNVIEHLRDL